MAEPPVSPLITENVDAGTDNRTVAELGGVSLTPLPNLGKVNGSSSSFVSYNSNNVHQTGTSKERNDNGQGVTQP